MDKELFKDLLNLIAAHEVKVSDDETRASWHESIMKATQLRRRHRIALWGAVASLAILLLVGGTLLFRPSAATPSDIVLYALEDTDYDMTNTQDIKLIMAEGEMMTLGGNESNIDYSTVGKIIVDRDTLTVVADDTSVRYNQIIVPYGKRTNISLSDGTRIIINSGTNVTYPLRFGVGDREIYIDGEAYFDVAHDNDRPFIVHTADMTVRVLGTTFNVFAYKDAPEKSVVLVNGLVEVKNNHISKCMRPNQMVTCTASSLSNPHDVDVSQYISWVNNTLQYNNCSLESVFSQLHYYYGVDFEVADNIGDMYVVGKLDLKESIQEVMTSIAYSVPITVTIDNNKIKVEKGKN